jgi:hypothetical protein
MPAFETISTPRPDGPGRFITDFPDGWQQGRGAFGGLVLATMARAAEAFAASPDRPIRTLTAELCAPVLPGAAELRVESLRAGSGTHTIAVRLAQGGELAAHAVVVLGRGRQVELGWSPPKPERPSWRDVPVVPPHDLGPPFARHLEYRPLSGTRFGGGEARAAGWVRPRDRAELRDPAFLIAMADAWWPAIFGLLELPRPMATITFTVDVVGDCAGLDPDAPYFHQSHTLALADGWAPELRTLWGEDGRLLAVNHQTFVVIR